MKTKNLLKKNKMTGGFFRLMKVAAIACGLCVAMNAPLFADDVSVRFTEQPRGQTVTEGEVATFTVAGVASWITGPNPQNNFGLLDLTSYSWGAWEYKLPYEEKWYGITSSFSPTLNITADARLSNSELRYAISKTAGHGTWLWHSHDFYSQSAYLTVRAAPPVITHFPAN